jgi:hypothetical protein
MKTILKQIIRKYRTQPDVLLSALSEITSGELVRGIVDLLTARELRLHSRKRGLPLCERFYAYDEANPHVGGWLLSAAQELKEEQHRERYGIGALVEEMRWDVRLGISKTDGFRIGNDYQACYVRQLLMRDPSLCGLFTVNPSEADALVVDGREWTDFAKEHEAELWPKTTSKKKPANDAQYELPFGETA